MRFKLPIPRGRDSYAPVNSTEKTPRCSSSDGVLQDVGNRPYAFNAQRLSEVNENYRTALWTGKHLQLTVMSIPPSAEPISERYDTLDRMIVATSGYGEIEIEPPSGKDTVRYSISGGYAAIIPAGARHCVRNTGQHPFRFYSVYTRPVHPYGDSIK